MLAIIGQTYRVQNLFVDSTNVPVAVLNPKCTAFYLDSQGAKQLLADQVAMSPVGVEVGRFQSTFAVPDLLETGTPIFVEMEAQDPILPGRHLTTLTLTAYSLAGVGSLATLFVRGG